MFQHGRTLKPVHQDTPITRRQMYAHGDTILVVPKGWGKGGEESVFRGYKISVLQDEDVLGSLVEQSECV